MIKKLALATALLLVAHLSMSAAYSIVIHRAGGEDEAVLLDKKPVLKFDATALQLTVDENVIAIPCDDIQNIEFIDDYNGIDRPESIADLIEVIDANTIRINQPDGTLINVYDTAGRAAAGVSVASDGAATTISLAQCAPGIYVIVYNNKSLKIVKK